LRDTLSAKIRQFGSRLSLPFKGSSNIPIDGADETREFWALKNLSLEVQQGERIGIIGPNGAGKSTILKILSRITDPTKGRIQIKGRVASLLEVGTGFHPELTGRENIFLNGAILGMKRAEIRKKFDDIVDFAEMGEFIDTPVKRYSSGMYVRLAFSVAAHLEPEILIVDEVLAVGDAQFQKRCLGKMEDVGRSGRTVLFVSHNMSAISNLCSKGLYLQKGKAIFFGDVKSAISAYFENSMGDKPSLDSCLGRAGSGGMKYTEIWIENRMGQEVEKFSAGETISIVAEAEAEQYYQNNRIAVGFAIDTASGNRLFTAVSSWKGQEIRTDGKRIRVKCKIESVPLVPGKYYISASLIDGGETLDVAACCLSFEVTEDEMFHLRFTDGDFGILNLPYQFEVSHV